MYNNYILIFNLLILLSCSNYTPEETNAAIILDTQDRVLTKTYFTETDAENVLGEKCHLKDSSWGNKDNIVKFQSTYSAFAPDEKTGKTGVVYFMIEQYGSVKAAQEAYTTILKANSDHQGIKTLNDVGDEAYFHTDETNFCFVLARTSNLLFRIKVNKLTSHTSNEEFNKVSKRIAAEVLK